MSIKKDAFGSTSFRENIILKTDTKDKANFCKRQFQSAFTYEAASELPSKGASIFFSMENITGIARLLGGLNVHKAPCQDGLNARVLKECSNEISRILALIFNESFMMSQLLLTCISCKTLEVWSIYLYATCINRQFSLTPSYCNTAFFVFLAHRIRISEILP